MTGNPPARLDAAASVPMPFVYRDVARHTWTTFGVFMLVAVVLNSFALTSQADSVLGMDPIGQFLTYTVVVGICAFSLTWLGAPLAWLLGRMMRGVPSPGLHTLAFAALGFAAGLALAAAVLVGGPIEQSHVMTAVLVGVISGACAAAGRYTAYRLRRRDTTRALAATGTDQPAP